jgi:hypothetical protein
MYCFEVFWRQEPDCDNGFPILSKVVVAGLGHDSFVVFYALCESPNVVGVRIWDMTGYVLQKNDVVWHHAKRLFD